VTKKVGEMLKRKHTPKQIITELCEVEAALSTGGAVIEAIRQIGVADEAIHRWRNECGA